MEILRQAEKVRQRKEIEEARKLLAKTERARKAAEAAKKAEKVAKANKKVNKLNYSTKSAKYYSVSVLNTINLKEAIEIDLLDVIKKGILELNPNSSLTVLLDSNIYLLAHKTHLQLLV